MEDFLLIFRKPGADPRELPEAEVKRNIEKWTAWFNSKAAEGRLTDMLLRLDQSGKVLKANGVITDGPFVETRERLLGVIVVSASSLEEATAIAGGCPILQLGGSVEVRSFHHVAVPGAKPANG